MSCGWGRGPAESPERGRSPPSGRRPEDEDRASSPMRGRMGTQGSPVKSYDYLLKFLLVGDSDVGKGEILESLQDGASESPYAYSNGERGGGQHPTLPGLSAAGPSRAELRHRLLCDGQQRGPVRRVLLRGQGGQRWGGREGGRGFAVFFVVFISWQRSAVYRGLRGWH